LKARATFT